MLPIDAAAHSSRWRRRHPVDKAVLGLGLTVLAISLPPWPGAALVLVTALTVLLGPAGVPGRRLWRAYRVPLGFCVTGAATLLVQVGGGHGFVSLAADGPLRAGELLLRTSAASLGVLLFAFTTPMSDLLPRLVKAGVPAPGAPSRAAGNSCGTSPARRPRRARALPPSPAAAAGPTSAW